MKYYLDVGRSLVLVILTPPVPPLLFIAARARARNVTKLLGFNNMSLD